MVSPLFPADYAQSRQTFRDFASLLDAELNSYAVVDTPQIAESIGTENEKYFTQPEIEFPMTMETATFGNPDSEVCLIVSSGLHGVEGFLGAAVQFAIMEELQNRTSAATDFRVLLIHAMNPFGYHSLRRANESNVDLNRNFFESNESQFCVNPEYGNFDSLLNPSSAPHGLDLFKIQAMGLIAKHGIRKLRGAIATGQSDYPRGLFYGGQKIETTTRLIQQNFGKWIGKSNQVLHLDIHSGLGAYGKCKLLLSDTLSEKKWERLASHFGRDQLEVSGEKSKTSYASRGTMANDLHLRFMDSMGKESPRRSAEKLNDANAKYLNLTVEFGTYSNLKVLSAMRNENRCHFYDEPDRASFEKAKRDMKEFFCPSDSRWREGVIETSRRLLAQSESYLRR